MRVAIACVLLLGGCDRVFDFGEPTPADGATIPTDLGGTAGTCYGKYGNDGAGLLRVCLEKDAESTVTLGASIRTDTDCSQIVQQTDPDQTKVCVIAAVHLTIGSAIPVRGPNPLVLVGTESVAIDGAITIDSKHNGGDGGGSDFPGCKDNAQDGNDGATSGSGGAGGTFGGAGGDGASAGPTLGGAAALALPFGFVRGGCRGGQAGGGANGASGGNGGSSGGALYVISGGTITVSALINASGSGGHPGQHGDLGGNGGGGGGGSGGLIGLDAPNIIVMGGARLVANGGGGGGGAGNMVDGMPGDEANAFAGTYPYGTVGGEGGNTGTGHGGAGGAGPPPADGAAAVASPQGGGGGGGGGAGAIRFYGAMVIIDPTVQPSPTPGA